MEPRGRLCARYNRRKVERKSILRRRPDNLATSLKTIPAGPFMRSLLRHTRRLPVCTSAYSRRVVIPTTRPRRDYERNLISRSSCDSSLRPGRPFPRRSSTTVFFVPGSVDQYCVSYMRERLVFTNVPAISVRLFLYSVCCVFGE